MSDLAGKVVFITGAARGIGAEVARVLASRGARVALAGLEPDRLAALAHELGPAHTWSECDVTDQAALDAAVQATVRQFGRLDVVIANAGIAAIGTVTTAPVDALVRVLEVNLIDYDFIWAGEHKQEFVDKFTNEIAAADNLKE